MKEVAEKTFVDKLLQNYQTNPNVKYVPANVDDSDLKAYIVDKMFVKGMDVDRSKNDTNYDYYYINSHEKDGLRVFSHKFNQGDYHYYYMREFKDDFAQLTDRLHEEDPHAYFELRDEIQNKIHAYKQDVIRRDFALCVRVVLQLEKGSLGKFTGCDGEYSDSYTGNHIAVFEC